MRFLFVTIQGFESAFYGRVGDGLVAHGHEVTHLTFSRRAARRLRNGGRRAVSLLELEAPRIESVAAAASRVEQELGLSSIRELYRTDPLTPSFDEETNICRAATQALRVAHLIDSVEPDVVVPEVGNEILRIAAHEASLARGIPTFFLFYTIFPRPLRLYVDEMSAPIVDADELRALEPSEEAELDAFRAEYLTRRTVIRPHRPIGVSARNVRRLRDYIAARIAEDRDNPYLRPLAWTSGHVKERIRRAAASTLYDAAPDGRRPFVYFPLHVVDDYKIKRLIPHCANQEALVDLVADALPAGYDLVLKEHPMSIGRNDLALLRRLKKSPNVRLVSPQENTHELVQRAAATAVISSTVGLEALLYPRPVLTLGRPFYAGYGITVDVDSFADIPDKVGEVLRFSPNVERTRRFLHAAMRKCLPGAPVMVDDSDANAQTLAASLAEAARALAPRTSVTR